MQEVGDLFRQNAIRPLPQISEFPVSHVDEALMTLSRESTGQKTVISLEDAESYVKVASPRWSQWNVYVPEC
jgi:hypothetical protein